MSLPADVRSLFWEYGDRELSLDYDRDFVSGRILSAGDWSSIQWLRQQIGDSAIADYLDRTAARLLSPRQIRLWQVLLDLPEDIVARWLAKDARRLWDRRAG